MREGQPIPEKESEHVPTPEEVREVFEQLGTEGYETVRQLEDEQGLYLWNITVSGEGGDTEYSYRRGRSSEGQLPGLRIDAIFFDETGSAVGGHSVAKYIEGEWMLAA